MPRSDSTEPEPTDIDERPPMVEYTAPAGWATHLCQAADGAHAAWGEHQGDCGMCPAVDPRDG